MEDIKLLATLFDKCYSELVELLRDQLFIIQHLELIIIKKDGFIRLF